MEKETITIDCPHCGKAIKVDEILHHKIEDDIRKSFEKKNAKKEKEIQEKIQEIHEEKRKLAEERNRQTESVERLVQSKLKAKTSELEKSLRQKIEDEKSEQFRAMDAELKQKSEQVKELNRTKADLARVTREKDELHTTIVAEQERLFNAKLTTEREKIKHSESDKNKFEIQKRDKLIDDLNKRLEDAQTKLELGSNQLSGEVKEIELRDFLKFTFPMDEIQDVPTGMNGGDVIQNVKNSASQPSGIILYERKQTQTFGKDWTSKLKEDGRRIKADICVIVTLAMPSDNSETHFRDGVWICTPSDVKVISMLLRDGLLKQYTAIATQTGKGTKMEMLYDYLRSSDFQNHIIGILDAFRKMDKSLLKERGDAMKRFSEREAHIFQAKQSVLNFYGRVDGIATDALSKEIKMLESEV